VPVHLYWIYGGGSKVWNWVSVYHVESGIMSATVKSRPLTENADRHSFWRENGLSLTVVALFLVFMAAQTVTGLYRYNHEQGDHGRPQVTLAEYLTTGHFLEATAENWESEFLQMAAYVLLTIGLFQRGSSESKKIGEPEAVDRDPRNSKHKRNAPWPVRRGGWVLKVYENSLSLAFLLLFLVSFILHAMGGARVFNEEQLEHGGQTVSVLQYFATSQFWFESFQNWQSEFLSLASMVVLSIYLRQRGSPESKPVDAAHSDTGSE
jgi:hypothetical protein